MIGELAAGVLKALKATLWVELSDLVLQGLMTPPAAIKAVFDALVKRGSCSEHDRLAFTAFAAPVARRMTLERSDPEQPLEVGGAAVGEWKVFLGWLDRYDSTAALMMDLHCFGGLTADQVASLLGYPRETVITELKKYRGAMQLRLL